MKQKAATRRSATADCEQQPKVLFELEDSVAYNSTIDLDVDTIGADSESTHAQIVYVLTATNSEV